MIKSKFVKPSSYITLIVVLFLIPLFIPSPYYLSIFIMCGINVILATSLRVVYNCGELSIAHGGMMLLGAYTSGLLVLKLGVSTWLALVMGGVAATTLALIVGFPLFRLRGIYFAIVTAFLSEVISLTAKQWSNVTGGTMGLTGIPKPDPIVIPRLLEIGFTSTADMYYLILVLVLITILILYAIEHSRIFTTWISIRESNDLAASVGVNLSNYKVLAFCVCCFFPGITGAFYSQYMGIIEPTSFGFTYSIYVIVYFVVGGVDNFIGPIIGALILTLIPEFARGLKQFEPYVFAGAMILIVHFMPQGIAGIPQLLVKIFKERRGHA
ncbi:branched-chain amino acid ABC transporter permease [Thermodesulfobacteriota bacterium]